MRRGTAGALVAMSLAAMAALSGVAQAQEWEKWDDTERKWREAGEERAGSDRAEALKSYPAEVKAALAKKDSPDRHRLYLELQGFCRKISDTERAKLCDALLEAMPEKGDSWPFWDEGLRLWKAEQLIAAGTPKEAKPLAEAVQKSAGKQKDRHTEGRARWLLGRIAHAAGNKSEANKQLKKAAKLAGASGEPFLLVRLQLLRARLATTPKKAEKEIRGAEKRITALEHAADRATLLAPAVETAKALELADLAAELEQARAKAAASDPPTTSTMAATVSTSGNFGDVFKKAAPTDVVLIVERKDDELRFESPQLGSFNTASVEDGYTTGMTKGGIWSTDGPRVVLMGLRMGNSAEAGQPKRSILPPFVREFVLAPGDRVFFQACGRAIFRRGR